MWEISHKSLWEVSKSEHTVEEKLLSLIQKEQGHH